MRYKDDKNKLLLEKYLLEGDYSAYEQLMIDNEKLIYHCIDHLVDIPHLSNEEKVRDFYGVAYIGLHNAINNFDLSKSDAIAFSTYAYRCIHNQIRKEKLLYKNDDRNISLEAPIHNSLEEPIYVKDMLVDPDDGIEAYIDNEYDNYVLKEINDLLGQLGENTRLLIEIYFGLNGKNKKNQEEIGEIYGIARTYITMIINDFKDYLRLKLTGKNPSKANQLLKSLIRYENSFVKSRESLYKEKLLKEYTQEAIEKVIDLQPVATGEFLRRYFGFKGPALDSEISSQPKFKVYTYEKLKEIESILKEDKGMTEISKDQKIEYLIEKYGKEKVVSVIGNLSDLYKTILTKYYGLSGEECKDFKKLDKMIGNKDSRVILFYALKTLEKHLMYPDRVVYKLKNREKLNNLYDKYGEKKINQIIDKFDDTTKKMFGMYFGEEDKSGINPKSIDNTLGVKDSSRLINDILLKIEEDLLLHKKKNKK